MSKRDLSSPLAATPHLNPFTPDPDKKAARKARRQERKDKRGARKSLKISKKLEKTDPVYERHYNLND